MKNGHQFNFNITRDGKILQSRFLISKICLLTLFAKIKFSLQYFPYKVPTLVDRMLIWLPCIFFLFYIYMYKIDLICNSGQNQSWFDKYHANCLFSSCTVVLCSLTLGDLRFSGSIIRKSRFIFTKERRTIRQKSGGANQGFLKRGFICIKVWRFALLVLSHLS